MLWAMHVKHMLESFLDDQKVFSLGSRPQLSLFAGSLQVQNINSCRQEGAGRGQRSSFMVQGV